MNKIFEFCNNFGKENTFTNGQMICRNGQIYRVDIKIENRGLSSITDAISALALTIITLGLGVLFSKTIRNLWSQALTRQKKIVVLNKLSLATEKPDKTLAKAIKKESVSPEKVKKVFPPNEEIFNPKLETDSSFDHLAFLRDKGITVKNVTKLYALNSKKEKEILKVISVYLRQSNKPYFDMFLGPRPDQSLLAFEQIFPKIMIIIHQFLSDKLASQAKNITFSTDQDLLTCRTVVFDSKLRDDLTKRVVKELEIFKIGKTKEILAFILIKKILGQLVKGKEIASYKNVSGESKFYVYC